MKKRIYRDYIQDIFDAINDTESFIEGMTLEDFAQDKKTCNAVIRSLEVIGEAAKKIPGFIRKQYPGVPWKRMAGMRDKMIHEYFGVDIEILWKTAKEDIPPLRNSVEAMLENPGI